MQRQKSARAKFTLLIMSAFLLVIVVDRARWTPLKNGFTSGLLMVVTRKFLEASQGHL